MRRERENRPTAYETRPRAERDRSGDRTAENSRESGMGTGTRIAKVLIRIADFIVDLIVIGIVLILVGYGAYSIWDTQQIYNDVSTTLYETYKPTGDDDDLSFGELQAMNPDVMGWITVYGTGIDYPLLQAENNDKYMNTTATGEFALGGAIFLDYTNAADFSDFNSIIYGHHMEESMMFGDVDKFQDRSYFDSHRYGNLYYEGRNHGLEFLAMVDADAYDFTLYNAHVVDPAVYLAYIESIATNWREDCDVTTEDHLVMLSTCADASTNGRYVLFGVIRDETFEDTFVTEEVTVTRTLTIPGTTGELPVLYVVIALILIAILLIVILVLTHLNRKRRERQARREAREARRAIREEDAEDEYGTN